jgi:hypothetical protein
MSCIYGGINAGMWMASTSANLEEKNRWVVSCSAHSKHQFGVVYHFYYEGDEII